MEINITTIGAYLGAALSIGFGAIGSGISKGMIANSAVKTYARQPGAGSASLMMMLITQAITETASIFALLVALILVFQGSPASWVGWAGYIAAGLSIGIGSLGSGIGSGLPGIAACESVTRQPENNGLIMKNVLIAQAVAQTPVIFSLVVSLLLIFQSGSDSLVRIFALFGAGLAMGFGAVGPGIGSGMAGQTAIEMVGRYKKESPLLLRTMLLGQSVAQSTAIYAMVIAFILIFVAI